MNLVGGSILSISINSSISNFLLIDYENLLLVETSIRYAPFS